MTTWELDKLIQDFIVKHGGKPNFKGLYGFPGSACISLNDTVIHGIPSSSFAFLIWITVITPPKPSLLRPWSARCV